MSDRLRGEVAEAGTWLDSLFDHAPIGLGFWDTDLRYQRVNERLAETNGVPAEEHIGRTLQEVLPDIPEHVTEFVRLAAHEGIATLDIIVTGRTPAAPDVERVWSVSHWPVRDAGGVLVGAGVSVTEITEVVRAREQEARAQRALAVERATLREVIARSPVGMALVWGRSLRYEIVNEAGLRALGARDLVGRTVAEVMPPERAARAEERYRYVIATGEICHDPARVVELPEGRRYQDISLVPIFAQGEVAGVLAVFVDVTDQVAERAALVDDLRQEREIAETLQRALLPRRLAQIPGAEVAARYRAAGERYRVGGDFYDVFAEPADRWLAVVGDFRGKGAGAAALTAMARFTLHGEAAYERAPSRLLEVLNERMLLDEEAIAGDESRFCSLACASVTVAEDGLDVVVALAGHPQPLLIRRGRVVEPVGAFGDLVGVWPRSRHEDVTLHLGPGDCLVFYTDGVLEAGAPEQVLTAEELGARLPIDGALDADGLATALEELLRAEGRELRDDYAIVVLRVTPLED